VLAEDLEKRANHLVHEARRVQEVRVQTPLGLAARIRADGGHHGFGRLGAARKAGRELFGVARQIGARDRAVETAVDPDGSKKWMTCVLDEPIARKNGCRRAVRIDEALPAGEAPGARAEPDARGQAGREAGRLGMLPGELLRERGISTTLARRSEQIELVPAPPSHG
jgi:hypothetical protein